MFTFEEIGWGDASKYPVHYLNKVHYFKRGARKGAIDKWINGVNKNVQFDKKHIENVRELAMRTNGIQEIPDTGLNIPSDCLSTLRTKVADVNWWIKAQ